jgi:Fe2+ or Zn2+ uptake regulation protein
MSCEKAFLERLRERGFRLTPQREMVLAVMHGLDGFCTAEDIYSRVGEISSAVDISTVYRTLDLLQPVLRQGDRSRVGTGRPAGSVPGGAVRF